MALMRKTQSTLWVWELSLTQAYTSGFLLFGPGGR